MKKIDQCNGGTFLGIIIGLIIGLIFFIVISLCIKNTELPFLEKINNNIIPSYKFNNKSKFKDEYFKQNTILGEELLEQDKNFSSSPKINNLKNLSKKSDKDEKNIENFPKENFVLDNSEDINNSLKEETNEKIISREKNIIYPEKNSNSKEKIKYFLQIGAYKNKLDAEEERARLALKGIESNIIQSNINSILYYKVHVGPFLSNLEISLAQKKLFNLNVNSIILTINNN